MNGLVASLLFSLALTLAVEVTLAAVLRVRGWDLVLVGLINCVTNPIVNVLYNAAWLWWGRTPWIPYAVAAALEIAVLFGEALFFKKTLTFRRLGALRLSLLLNAASFVAGELIVLTRALIS